MRRGGKTDDDDLSHRITESGDRPSPVLLSCGVPVDVARNAIRLSVGRSSTRAEVDLVVQDLKQAVARLEGQA